jgi:hypothetical protein
MKQVFVHLWLWHLGFWGKRFSFLEFFTSCSENIWNFGTHGENIEKGPTQSTFLQKNSILGVIVS